MSKFDDRIREVLSRCWESDQIVGIHTNERDLERFHAGYVRSLSSAAVTLFCVDSKGFDDGITVIPLEEVLRLHTDTEYLRGVDLLYRNRDQVYRPTATSWSDGAIDDFPRALLVAKEQNQAVTLVDINEASLSGIVLEVGEDWVDIEELKDNGQSDGTYTIYLGDIVRLEIGRQGEQANMFLHRIRYGLSG